MFARIKKSGRNEYLQLVENRREGKKITQRVVATIGRMDELRAHGDIETIIRSLSRFSEKVLLILSARDNADIQATAKKIGPAIIFERLWQELGIDKIIRRLLKDRKFEFDVERAIFLTVLHRLFISGSDRYCYKWRRDQRINGIDSLSLHHFYRAMAFLGEEAEDQKDRTPFTPRCIKDVIEEDLFAINSDLFTGVDLFFFDTTSIYFEGEGGETLGQKGHSKDHRPDLNQMVVGTLINDQGRPVCCEMWPGNTADVKTLLPLADRLKKRFSVDLFCLVADRGMISDETLQALDEKDIPYILGSRMRKNREVRDEVLSRPGRYQEVHPAGTKGSSPLKVKEVWVDDRRYIVCLNERQARKDEQDRALIIESLQSRLKKGPKALVGNRGYRKYLKLDSENIDIDEAKIAEEARYDGKWVLRTNTDLPAEMVALKYKELWQVEQTFRDMKSILETRPVFHQTDETIRGHVFCSFLALVLRKELELRLEKAGHSFEWSDIKQDLEALQEVTLEEQNKTLAVRTECIGTCGKIFQAVGVAIPPTIRQL
ncbi:MAG TPA: IS1634 family transposase [Syntrophales bacterium]|nr:IS1634 family transposase [Syntrophales bacterium]